MFLMNFLFDFDDRSGSFSGDRTSAARPSYLFTSKNWLKLIPSPGVPEPNPATFPAFNPELPNANWSDEKDMDSGALLLPSTPAPNPDEGHIGIRIALDPNSTAVVPLGPAGVDLTLAVCFGRPAQSRQTRSSPFFEGVAPNQVVQTTFVFTDQKSNRVNGAGPVSWFFPLGLVKHRTNIISRHRTHRYEFSVGMTVTRVTGGLTEVHHYSHDPEMDVAL